MNSIAANPDFSPLRWFGGRIGLTWTVTARFGADGHRGVGLGQQGALRPAGGMVSGDVGCALSGSWSACRSGEGSMGDRPVLLPGMAGGHGHGDPAHRDPDQGAELEQLAADGAGGGLGEPGRPQADPAQRLEQDIGHRGKPQAELIGGHGPGRGAVGKKIELALFDPVLHLAAGAIELFVEWFGRPGRGGEAGHDG